MRRNDKYIAIGVTPCKRAGHRMRNRYGTCVVCDTAQMAFSKRYKISAHVYIAQPAASSVVKIGMTSDIEKREASLNYREYGGHSDWKILASAYVENAGLIEAEIQGYLIEYQVEGYYFDGPRKQQCLELFGCSLKKALAAFSNTVGNMVVEHVDLAAWQKRSESPLNLNAKKQLHPAPITRSGSRILGSTPKVESVTEPPSSFQIVPTSAAGNIQPKGNLVDHPPKNLDLVATVDEPISQPLTLPLEEAEQKPLVKRFKIFGVQLSEFFGLELCISNICVVIGYWFFIKPRLRATYWDQLSIWVNLGEVAMNIFFVLYVSGMFVFGGLIIASVLAPIFPIKSSTN